MELEWGLPFLVIFVYRKGDGSSKRRVHSKPTHTNLYLNSNRLHYPHKNAVLSTLVCKPYSMSDVYSLLGELHYLRAVFLQNDYREDERVRDMYKNPREVQIEGEVKSKNFAISPFYTPQQRLDKS